MQVHIMENYSSKETYFKPKSDIDEHVALSRAIKKHFGVKGWFMQSHGVTQGIGTFLEPSGSVLGTGCFDIT